MKEKDVKEKDRKEKHDHTGTEREVSKLKERRG